MRRVVAVARKRPLEESRRGERSEWLRLSPEERFRAVEEMRMLWCAWQNPPCQLGKVAPVARKRPLKRD